MFKVGDKIKFKPEVQSIIDNKTHNYYTSRLWNEVYYMIITEAGKDSHYVIAKGFTIYDSPVKGVETGKPNIEDIEYMIFYNIEEIINDLDNLEQKLNGKLVSNISS